MKKNMGALDRLFRLMIAITIAGLYLAGIITGIWGIVLIIIASIFLVTSIISICPLYSLLGITTCSSGRSNKAV